MRKYKCSYLVQFVFVDIEKDDDRDNQDYDITVLCDNMEN